MKNIFILIFCTSFIYAQDFYYEFGKKVEVKQGVKSKALSSLDDIQEYETLDGKKVKFKNEIILKCNTQRCEEDFKTLELKNIEKISKNFYLIKLDASKNIFEYSQKLHNLKSVEFAHPNFIKQRIYR